MFLRLLPFALLALTTLPAHAGQSYDNCTGFIDSLPASIGTQGVWCLRKNLATAMTTGAAIALVANNVTIDCNEFKIGGLAGGPDTQAVGISASSIQSITVRNCGIRGFRKGIDITGGAGHVIEDNRLDNNTNTGISVNGEYSLVQRNRVFDMGGSPATTRSFGLIVRGDAVDNIIAGASGENANFGSVGIVSMASGGLVRGNRVSGLQSSGTGDVTGIWLLGGQGVRLEHNHLHNSPAGDTAGIVGGNKDVCVGNSILGFMTPKLGCTLGSGDVVSP